MACGELLTRWPELIGVFFNQIQSCGVFLSTSQAWLLTIVIFLGDLGSLIGNPPLYRVRKIVGNVCQPVGQKI
jgi:hypothetical protein